MLRFVETHGGQQELSDEDLLERLKHHIDRGIAQISVRVKSPADIADLLSGQS